MALGFDFKSLPRCGAHAKTTGQPCQHAGNKRNGRCWLHGGRSTAAKTAEGKRKVREANLKHGRLTKAQRLLKQKVRLCVKIEKAELSGLRGYVPVLAQDPERYAEAVHKAVAVGEELEKERARLDGE